MEMKKFILILGLFLSFSANAWADDFRDINVNQETNQIIEKCEKDYPSDIINDKFSKITITQERINQCIRNHIISKAKNVFSDDMYEEFIKKINNFETAENELYSLIFLENTSTSEATEYMENWIIEKRKTEIFRTLLADIIYKEKWAD